MRRVCKMKSKSGADLSRISISNTFVQGDLCICLINCDTVAVKSFLLVNTRTFQNNPSKESFNYCANCAVNKRNFLLWV